MRIETQTSKTLTITSAEIQAILIDHLQREGMIEEGDDITVDNVPDVVNIQLVGKAKVIFESTTKLGGLVGCTGTVEVEDDTPSVEAKQNEPNYSSNILSGKVGDDPNSIFADPIGDKPKSVVTRDIFIDPDEDVPQIKSKVMTENIWEDG